MATQLNCESETFPIFHTEYLYFICASMCFDWWYWDVDANFHAISFVTGVREKRILKSSLPLKKVSTTQLPIFVLEPDESKCIFVQFVGFCLSCR